MSGAPLVSVLLPVRDAEPYLEEAIRSLEAQTFADFEVLAVDDGSSDASAELLAEWSARDRRVRPLRQQRTGIVAALERARSESRGVYLARMDADDISEPSRFAVQLALMCSDPALALCGCGVTYFPETEVREGAARYEQWINACVTPERIARDVFVECPVPHPTFFMRASVVERVGGYRESAWPEDYDLVLRLWSANHRLGKAPERLLRWRRHCGTLSLTDSRYAPEAFLACKVHYLRRTLLRGRRGVVIWGAGPVGKAASRALSAAGAPILGFVEIDPRKLGQRIHGAPVVDAAAGLEIEGSLHLAAVGQPGARERIQGLLEGAGLEPLTDFVAIA